MDIPNHDQEIERRAHPENFEEQEEFLCPYCGADLSEVEEEDCPECGREINL